MQTRLLLLALLSAIPAAAVGQVPTNAAIGRINPAIQRQRDEARTAILQDELVAEALQLADAQRLLKSDPTQAGQAAERISRHRRNISALAREIALTDKQTSLVHVKQGSTAPASARETQPLTASLLLNDGRAVRVDEEPRTTPKPAGARPDWIISGREGDRPR